MSGVFCEHSMLVTFELWNKKSVLSLNWLLRFSLMKWKRMKDLQLRSCVVVWILSLEISLIQPIVSLVCGVLVAVFVIWPFPINPLIWAMWRLTTQELNRSLYEQNSEVSLITRPTAIAADAFWFSEWKHYPVSDLIASSSSHVNHIHQRTED